jgi:hypothetical protein
MWVNFARFWAKCRFQIPGPGVRGPFQYYKNQVKFVGRKKINMCLPKNFLFRFKFPYEKKTTDL